MRWYLCRGFLVVSVIAGFRVCGGCSVSILKRQRDGGAMNECKKEKEAMKALSDTFHLMRQTMEGTGEKIE